MQYQLPFVLFSQGGRTLIDPFLPNLVKSKISPVIALSVIAFLLSLLNRFPGWNRNAPQSRQQDELYLFLLSMDAVCNRFHKHQWLSRKLRTYKKSFRFPSLRLENRKGAEAPNQLGVAQLPSYAVIIKSFQSFWHRVPFFSRSFKNWILIPVHIKLSIMDTLNEFVGFNFPKPTCLNFFHFVSPLNVKEQFPTYKPIIPYCLFENAGSASFDAGFRAKHLFQVLKCMKKKLKKSLVGFFAFLRMAD